MIFDSLILDIIMVGISHEAELPKKPSIWAAIRHNGFAELMN